MAAAPSRPLTYLSQRDAARLDEVLMGPEVGFSVDQLMELAGFSVAQCVHKLFPPAANRSVLVVCGPGNNGGDGLVAARHLHFFGYKPLVVYPRRTESRLYAGLVKQLEASGVAVEAALPAQPLGEAFALGIDAVFGFSFKPPVRAPFDGILKRLGSERLRIVSVDIPSGWDVERGDVTGAGLRPDVLVSLSAPKLCAARFEGAHFLGGRFVPKSVAAQFGLELPDFEGTEQVVRLSAPSAL